MEEPWDELMGPSTEDLKKLLREPAESTKSAARSDPPVRSSPSSGARPPPAMFTKAPDRWAPREEDDLAEQRRVTSYRTSTTAAPPSVYRTSSTPSSPPDYRKGLLASASAVRTAATHQPPPAMKPTRSAGLAFEDEEEETTESSSDHDTIRQEAIKMLQVAEAAGSSYSIQRTSSGGYSASSNSLGKEKRVRAALSGLPPAFSSRQSSTRSKFRDSPTQEGFEYGESDMNPISTNVVDVEGMERRSMSTRPREIDPPTGNSSTSKNWSSRYAVDNTLLALAGSSSSKRKSVLDKMDRDHDRTSRNLFGNSADGTKVFGSGFSFRTQHVFGKQNVTVKKPPPNLQTVWMDMEGSSSLPPSNARSKSWQEQLQQKRRQRRTYVLSVLCAFVFAITLGSIFGVRSNRSTGNTSSSSTGGSANTSPTATTGLNSAQTPIPPGSVTFYVTSDAPYSLADEERLSKDLQSLSPSAVMLFHLGNLQLADVTLCQFTRYANVASMLRESTIPTFVLPGQEDVNNCPDPTKAFGSWIRSFRFFHRHWPTNMKVMSSDTQNENFSVVEQGVLFLGLHLVGGRIWDNNDFTFRNQYNYEWVEGMSNTYHDSIRAVVVLGNARPGEPINDHLFQLLANFWKSYDRPVAYVHANSGIPGGTQVYTPFAGVDNVFGIQVGNSGDNPPLRLNVGFGSRPFIIG